MSEWDLVLFTDDKQKKVLNKLKLSEKTLSAAGQHGKATMLVDNQGKEWLLKVFSHIIDFDVKKVSDLDIDIQDTPEKSRERLHLWRVLNELTASRLGRRLYLNVPESHLICSGKIAKFDLNSDSILKEEDVVVLDEEEEEGESAEEFYHLSEREIGSLTTSKRFEDLLAQKSVRKKSIDVLAILQEKIPNSQNIDEYLDDQKADLDGAFAAIQSIDDAFLLLPFDIWLNDPDRNAGNYLVQMDKNNVASHIWGIDYEMWSFGSDIWMEEDDITQGRSYLTAIIHPKSHIFDSRVNQTFYRIRMLQDEEIIQMTKAPTLACKFFEYHISKGNLLADEREKLKHVEVNLEDFLIESRPRSDKLSETIARQIGLPREFKT